MRYLTVLINIITIIKVTIPACQSLSHFCSPHMFFQTNIPAAKIHNVHSLLLLLLLYNKLAKFGVFIIIFVQKHIYVYNKILLNQTIKFNSRGLFHINSLPFLQTHTLSL